MVKRGQAVTVGSFDRAHSGHGWQGSLHSAGPQLRDALTWLLSAEPLAAAENTSGVLASR